MAGSITGRIANGGVPRDCGGAPPGTCSGFKVFVDGRHIQHHILPVGPLRPHHLINVLTDKEMLVRIPDALLAHPNSNQVVASPHPSASVSGVQNLSGALA